MTTTEKKPQRPFQGIIQSITDKVSKAKPTEANPTGEWPYFTIALNPRPGMKWADSYNGRNMALKEDFKPGDSVILTLQQGKPKETEGEFWWDVVGIERVIIPETVKPITPAKTEGEPQKAAPLEKRAPAFESDQERRDKRIAQAHLENIRADCQLAASIISAARAILSKDLMALDLAAIKKLANDFYLVIRAKA